MHLLKRFVVSSALLCISSAAAASAPGEAGRDAFVSSPAARPLAIDPAALPTRGAHVEAFERRLGLPTILWSDATPQGRGPASTPEAAARLHLQRFADLYRLRAADVAEARLQGLHDTGSGAVIAQFGQSIGGVELFRNRLSVVMDPNLELVSINGWLAPTELVAKAQNARFALGARAAVAEAFRVASGLELDPASFVATTAAAPWQRFGLDRPAAGWRFTSPARAKQVFFTLPDRLVPAWYVELHAGDVSRTDSRYESFVISAEDGTLLFRNDLRADDAYTWEVWADPASFEPHDGPQGTDASPLLGGVPNGWQPAVVGTHPVTLPNLFFSRNDPWLPPNATETRGNNVDAYADLAAPDGFQFGADLRATSTAPGVFGHVYDTTQGPGSAAQQQASVTTLFYLTNFFHDWYYDAGFDEQAGNAQTSNYGRGGFEGDPLLAEAQDYAGQNNARMFTPADGASPVLQLHVYTGDPLLQVTSPASLAGTRAAGAAAFGANQFLVSGPLQIPNPTGVELGCTTTPGSFAGTIVLIDRGVCAYELKALNAQNAGATAVVIANNVPNQLPPALGGAGGGPSLVTIPVISVTKETADAWKAAVHNGDSLTVSLERGPRLDRDSAVDATLVAHEWSHLLSNRLVGNANGLGNPQGRALGEGWGDFHALLLMVRDMDRVQPGNDRWQGVYPIGSWVGSGGEPWYYGIRRAPYSTDFTKNGLTFQHLGAGKQLPTTNRFASGQNGLQNAEMHNAGEVWASMLWECYASLLNAHPYSEARDRMKRYVVAAYKATPISPTLLEARDALLSVAAASDPADLQRFRAAFAKRGAGAGAVGPDRDSQDFLGIVESYATGANLATTYALDDGLVTCDQDGILDVGEAGFLIVTVRNTGWNAIPSFTATVGVPGGGATMQLPNGNVISFPSLAPGQSAQGRIPVQLAAASGWGTRAQFSLVYSEPSLPAQVRVTTLAPVVQYDVNPGGATADSFEGQRLAWIGVEPGDWVRAGPEDDRYLHVDDRSGAGEAILETPWLEVNPTGSFTMSFDTRYSFEASVGTNPPFWDGGVIEVSLDGIHWSAVFEDLGLNPLYTAYLEPSDNPLSGRAAYAGLSLNYPAWNRRTLDLGTLFAGQRVKIRFRAGFDGAVGAYGWDIDDVTFTNLANEPFFALAAEPAGAACNRRPIASARATDRLEGSLDAQGLLQRNVVTLDGSASFDPDGQPLAWQWTQVAGPTVVLSNANTAHPSFVADVAADTRYAFQLAVNDGADGSYPATVAVTVWNVNQPPVASATAPATVDERSAATVTLDGSGSSDPDGEELSYAWTQLAGPAVQLDDPGSPTPSFALPEVDGDTTLVFALVVDDGIDVSEQATVAVTVLQIDRPVMVDAGADRTVESGAQVILAGAAIDPDGDPIGFSWAQLAGLPVVLDDASLASPTFVAPEVLVDTDLVFELAAAANGTSATDTVVITVRALPIPDVDAGADSTVPGRSTVVLRGSASAGAQLLWTQLLGPAVELDRTDASVAIFTSPDVNDETTLVFQLTATTIGVSASDTVAIRVVPANHAPEVTATSPITVDEGQQVTLAADAVDPDGDALSFRWSQLGGPAVELSDAETSAPTFVAPAVGADTDLTFEVQVSDAARTSERALVTVHVRNVNEGPVASARAVVRGRFVTLDGSASADPDGGALRYAWVQTGGDPVELDGADAAVATFELPGRAAASLSFELVVTDAAGGTSTAPVAVDLAAVKAPKKASSGGCSTSGGNAGPLSLLLVAGAVLASRRRNR